MGRLFLFTATFPYDGAESFLEDEIFFLKEAFDTVTIIPMTGKEMTRTVPAGCEVYSPVEKKGVFRYFHLFVPNKTTLPFICDFFRMRVYMSLLRMKTWLIAYRIGCNLIQNSRIKHILNEANDKDVFYSYWGKGSSILSLFTNKNAKFVSRFHGEWDLWEESSGGYAPLRDRIAERLDLAAFISKKGELYFKNKYRVRKTGVFPLGSFDKGISKRSDDGVLHIVSCSTVYPLKRVELIHDALLASNLKIVWTHIGAGPSFNQLVSKVESETREGLEVVLVGQVSHDDVIQYYQTHVVDLFINLSTNEGVPVSIMEAISFDIPAVATNVGATSEIVCDETGFLLTPNPQAMEVADAIHNISKIINDLHPRDYWKDHYDAEKNYRFFAETLAQL